MKIKRAVVKKKFVIIVTGEMIVAAVCILYRGLPDKFFQNISSGERAVAETQSESVEETTEAAPFQVNVQWENIALEAGISSKTEILAYEQRFINETVCYQGDYSIRQCWYSDYDLSGKNDLILMVANESGTATDAPGAYLYFFMNEDVVYTKAYSTYFWGGSLIAGDIDHDENTELIYWMDLGGNGGSGAYAKGILKYQDHSLKTMTIPGDYHGGKDFEGEVGYQLELTYAEGDGNYKVTCPGLDRSEIIHSEYTTYEDGTLFLEDHGEGIIVGAEGRGYYTFYIQQEAGRSYLAAEEYFFGEGGINDGKGYATFVFNWDENGNGFVKEFQATSYEDEKVEEGTGN